MKKRIILFISIIQIVALSACGKAANVTPIESGITESEPARNSRVLIAYFSQPTDVDTSDLDAVSSESVVVRDNGEAGSSSDTVAGAKADSRNQQTLYLWEENDMPAITEYTENNGYYADNPDFRPYMVTFPVSEGTEVSADAAADSGAPVGSEAVSNETISSKTISNEKTTSPEYGGAIDMDPEENIARIPDTPLQIPNDYYSPASEQGRLERLEYTTYESFSYEERTKQLMKTAYVYLPYGYSEDSRYNVFYLMHGGWANETTYLGTPESPNVFKSVVDHAVQDGKMEPIIIVCPTYNNENPDDSDDYGLALRLTDNYHNELLNDLIPAVEGKYSTYAEGTSIEELERSRDHRAFCGFSMGSVTTWHTFEYCLPYFRYFLPSSGDLTSDGQYMESIVTNAGYGPEDFFIYAMSGTRDFDYSAFSRQIQAMLEAPGGIFIEADNERDGNLAYRVQEGNEHNGESAMQYIYNGLVWLWKGEIL